MQPVKQIILRHDAYVTATVNAYTARLDEIVATATARTIADLQRRLALLPNGRIAPTAANTRILRKLDALFIEEMDAAGFGRLNNAYVSQFSGQIHFLDDIIENISAQMATPLPSVKQALNAADRRALAAQQASTVANLETVIDSVAALAKRQALLSMAGLPMRELAATLAGAFQKTAARATPLAELSQVAFYRTAADQTYRVIEEGLPSFVIKYEYDGPLDSLNRIFCRRMCIESRAGKRWTRAELNALDSGKGQPKPVMIYGGGWGCRHQAIIAVDV